MGGIQTNFSKLFDCFHNIKNFFEKEFWMGYRPVC